MSIRHSKGVTKRRAEVRHGCSASITGRAEQGIRVEVGTSIDEIDAVSACPKVEVLRTSMTQGVKNQLIQHHADRVMSAIWPQPVRSSVIHEVRDELVKIMPLASFAEPCSVPHELSRLRRNSPVLNASRRERATPRTPLPTVEECNCEPRLINVDLTRMDVAEPDPIHGRLAYRRVQLGLPTREAFRCRRYVRCLSDNPHAKFGAARSMGLCETVWIRTSIPGFRRQLRFHVLCEFSGGSTAGSTPYRCHEATLVLTRR